MNEQANILFDFDISSSISGHSAGKIELSLQPSYLQRSFYAALARGLYIKDGFESLGRRLAAIVRHASYTRQIEVMREASQLMLALPLSKGQHSVAQYYQALWFKKQGDFENAYELLGKAADTAPSAFRPQVLLSI